MFPVIYDLDPETNEATGTVHFFCSTGCRSQSPHKLPDASNYGENGPAEVPAGSVCELCGKELQPAVQSKYVTIDDAIAFLTTAKAKVGGNKVLVLSLTDSLMEDATIDALTLIDNVADGSGESQYVQVECNHPGLVKYRG